MISIIPVTVSHHDMFPVGLLNWCWNKEMYMWFGRINAICCSYRVNADCRGERFLRLVVAGRI